MQNNSPKERAGMEKALSCLDEWFRKNETVTTPLGESSTINGYQISRIAFFEKWIKVSVYVLDRSVKKNDALRGGDEVTFLYYGDTGKFVLSD